MTRLVSAAVAATIPILAASSALADHGGATAAGPANPLVVAVIAGLLTLAIGVALVALVVRLGRKTPRSE